MRKFFYLIITIYCFVGTDAFACKRSHLECEESSENKKRIHRNPINIEESLVHDPFPLVATNVDHLSSNRLVLSSKRIAENADDINVERNIQNTERSNSISYELKGAQSEVNNTIIFSLYSVPSDIKYAIFNKQEWMDILALSITCMEFNRIFNLYIDDYYLNQFGLGGKVYKIIDNVNQNRRIANNVNQHSFDENSIKRNIRSLNLPRNLSNFTMMDTCNRPVGRSFLMELPRILNMNYLEELDLSNNDLNGNFYFLSKLPSNLRVLKIRGCNLSHNDWKSFLLENINFNKLEVLDIANNGMENNETTKQIILKLGKFNKLKALYLSLDSFDGEEKDWIGDYNDETNILMPLSKHKKLNTLEVRGCKDSNIYSVSQLLSRIESLDYLGIFSSKSSAIKYCDTIINLCKSVETQSFVRQMTFHLNVENNNISFKFPCFNSQNLKNLSLKLPHAYSTHKSFLTLDKINLEALYVYGQINTHIINAIQTQTNLKILWLEDHSNLSEDEFDCLATTLTSLKNLTDLGIVGYNINGDKVARLRQILESKRNLKYLDLSYNYLTEEEMISLSSLNIPLRCECYVTESILGRGVI